MNIFNWLKSAFSIKGRMRGDSFRSYRCNQCNRMEQKLREKKILENAPKVVAVGGGTGLSVLLRGLKKYTSNITAIVTVADDGGGSGVLREDLGMLPPEIFETVFWPLRIRNRSWSSFCSIVSKRGHSRGKVSEIF